MTNHLSDKLKNDNVKKDVKNNRVDNVSVDKCFDESRINEAKSMADHYNMIMRIRKMGGISLFLLNRMPKYDDKAGIQLKLGETLHAALRDKMTRLRRSHKAMARPGAQPVLRTLVVGQSRSA